MATMSNSDAIRFIDGRMLELTCRCECEKTDAGKKRINEEYDFLCLARDAIHKATPTMVTHNATKPEDCTCPSCGNVVSEFATSFGQRFRVTCSYCRICGQALKWEGS